MNWFKKNMVMDNGIIAQTKTPALYPEVTGYYLPMLYNWGERELARTCARWLLSIQLPNEAFPAPDVVPYTFDTGQVMHGLRVALNDVDGIEAPSKGAQGIPGSGINWAVKHFLTTSHLKLQDDKKHA